MKRGSKIAVAILVGLSLGTFTSVASAAKKMQRDQAITDCITKVQAAYPFQGEQGQRDRTAAYKACMTNAGFRP